MKHACGPPILLKVKVDYASNAPGNAKILEEKSVRKCLKDHVAEEACVSHR